MKKLLATLEKNVHWITLGIGGIYLLWMVWSYVLMQPISTTVGSTTDATLGNIDRLTRQGPAQRLQTAMEQKPDQQMKVEPFAQSFQTRIEGSPNLPQLADNWTTAQAALIASQLPTDQENNATQPGIAADKLPTPPAPVFLADSQGLSTVKLPDTAQPSSGVQLTGASQPAQADRQWVSTSFSISAQALASSFTNAGIPQNLQSTYFLRVETIREELNGAGQWVNPTVVKPLKNQNLPPMITASQTLKDQLNYGDWAKRNQVNILQPAFYQVIAADRWLPPGYTPPPVMIQNVPFDPNNPSSKAAQQAEQRRLEQQRRQELLERQRQQQQQQRNRRTRTPRTPRPAPAYTPSYAPRDMDRQVLAQAIPQPPGMYPNPYSDPGLMPPTGYNPTQTADPSLPPPPPVPQTAFVPSQLQADITIWVHDDSVEAGKTYRYKTRYAIANPLLSDPTIIRNTAQAGSFILWSDYSNFSKPIEIPDLINFFVAANMGGASSVSFDIFRWADGTQHKQNVRAAAGDIIGSKQDNTDFSTGWTVVDVRADQNGDTYALLMDLEGELVRRDFRTDQKKELYQQLKKDVEAANSRGGR